jgi:hypothetical protein
MLPNDPLRLPPFHFDADQDPEPGFYYEVDPGPDFHFNADPNLDFHFNTAQNPDFHFNADPDPASQNDADPDSNEALYSLLLLVDSIPAAGVHVHPGAD